MLDNPLVHLPQTGSEGDGPVTAELLPGFAVLVDGNDYGVFPPRGERAPILAPLEEAQQNLQKRLGHLPQHVVRRGVHAGGHLNFLDSRQGSFEFGVGQRGVNRQTVVRLWVSSRPSFHVGVGACPQRDVAVAKASSNASALAWSVL